MSGLPGLNDQSPQAAYQFNVDTAKEAQKKPEPTVDEPMEKDCTTSADVAPNLSLRDRVILRFDELNATLDGKINNFYVQEKLDEFGRSIEDSFEGLRTKCRNWIEGDKDAAWYKALAGFLIKLPLRVVGNVLGLLFDILKTVLYFGVHPIKGIGNTFKILSIIIIEICTPENWAKIGTGMIGASFGHALVAGNPFTIVGWGIGATLAVAGVTISMFRAAYYAPTGQLGDSLRDALILQLKMTSESALLGFGLGCAVAGIEYALSEAQTAPASVYDLSPPVAGDEVISSEGFVSRYNLPKYSSTAVVDGGGVVMKWVGTPADPFPFRAVSGKLFSADDLIAFKTANELTIEVLPGSNQWIVQFGTVQNPLPPLSSVPDFPSMQEVLAAEVDEPFWNFDFLKRDYSQEILPQAVGGSFAIRV